METCGDSIQARTVLGKGPPAAPASRAEKDANLVWGLGIVTAAPAVVEKW